MSLNLKFLLSGANLYAVGGCIDKYVNICVTLPTMSNNLLDTYCYIINLFIVPILAIVLLILKMILTKIFFNKKKKTK